jgi:signal transduction histidine kinase
MADQESWLRAALEITSALLISADSGNALRLAAERARRLADAPVAAIALPDESSPGNLVFDIVDGIGMDAAKLTGISVPITETGSGLAFRTGQSQLLDNYGLHVIARSDDPDLSFPPKIRELDSALAVPLAFGPEVLGVLVLARFAGAPRFTKEELVRAEIFAGQATLAVQIAKAEQARSTLAVLADRDRIARDLHDLVIQRLFAIGLDLQSVRQATAGTPVADRVAGLVVDLDRTIQDIRRSIFSLHESAESPDSLRAELMATAGAATMALGFEPRIGFYGPLDTLVPDAVRPDLLACLREALSNAAKHADATAVAVDVVVDRRGRELTMVVADNGNGLPADVDRRSGLANLAERANRWGGTLDVAQRAGGGVRIEWRVPISPGGVP